MPSADTGRALQRAAIAFAVLLLIGFLIVHLDKAYSARALARETQASAAAVPTVEVVEVQPAAAAGSLTLPGETAAWYQSTIYARVDGYVSHWSVDIGDHVSAGALLATIDTPELDAELAAARAKLEVARSQVRVKQADAAFARSTYERWRDSPRGVVSDQEREDKKAADASAAAQLDAAQAQVRLDEADVERLSAFEHFKRVTAPYAGTITERRIDIGNLVTAGSSANTTLLYRMSQDDPIRVFVDVPQSAAQELMQPGVPARVMMGGASGECIAAAITRTSNAIDPKARTFRVELDVPNPTRRLLPGLYVRVAFQLQDSGLSQVPAAALSFRPAGPTVAAVEADGTVRFRTVTIARDDGDQVELSSGVSEGERLVLNVGNQITEGEKVRIVAGSGAEAPDLALRVQR